MTGYTIYIVFAIIGLMFLVITITKNVSNNKDDESGDGNKYPYKINGKFMSSAEKSFFHVLNRQVEPDKIVFAKVKLSDVLVPTITGNEKQGFLNKVLQKHVDFLVCDPMTLTPVYGVELDDKSHARASAKAADAFKDNAFAAAGLSLIRIKAKQGYNPDEIKSLITQGLSKSKEQR